MATSPNLKINLTADTSSFNKGMKQAKSDIRNLEGVASSSLTSIASAFGIPAGKIQQLSSSIRGLSSKFGTLQKDGTEATKGLSAGMVNLSAAVAGVGIAGLIAGFKALNDEASNFENTIAGLNLKMGTEAYISTLRQGLHDQNSELGRAMAENKSEWEKWWAGVTSGVGAGISNAFGGALQDLSGWEAAFPMASAVTRFADGWKDAKGMMEAVIPLAESAQNIAERQADIIKEQLGNEVRISELNAQIAEYKRIASDESYTTKEREEAIAKAREAINEKARLEIPLAQERAQLQTELNALAENGLEDTQLENSLHIAANNLIREQSESLRSLVRLQQRVTNDAQKEAEARAEAAAEAARIAAETQKQTERQDWVLNEKAGLLSIDDSALQEAIDSFQLALPEGGIEMKITPKLDEEGMFNFGTAISEQLDEIAVSLSAAFGSLIGDLATGGDAFKNFGNAAISAMADMAISVGKMAISTGTATIGIKKALQSLNGWAAIAAGAALVALGYAVKTGLSNVAAGNYSSASGSATIASASYGSSASDYEERELNIKVSGTLTASGSQLVAVLNNEAERQNHTT